MRTLPEAMAALLKSRKQIGADKPSYSVTVGGLSSGVADITDWSTIVPGIGRNDMEETIDGRAIMAYVDGVDIKIAYADSIGGFLDGSESFGTGTVVKSGATDDEYDVSLTKINNKLYLAIARYYPNPRACELYVSANGLGDDFVKLSDIETGTGYTGVTNKGMGYPLTKICILNNGNWAIAFCVISPSATYHEVHSYISTDSGDTWAYGATRSANSAQSSSKTLLPFGTDGFVMFIMRSTTETYLCDFHGSTCATVNPDFVASGACLLTVDNITYLLRQSGTTTVSIDQYAGDGSFASYAAIENYTQVKTITINISYCSYGLFMTNTRLVGIKISGGYFGTELANSNLPVKSISINRNKNMAASLDLLIDNKNGEWSPDGTTNKEILWPNKVVTVQQGYGTDLVTTFTGLIDRISMTSFPQEIVVSCRDYMKYLLDQLVTKAVEGGNTHILQYTSQTVEAIVTDLVTEAGLTLAETIYTTGITVDDITFSWCSWADAIQELADMSGADFGCDESGEFYFRKDYIPDTPTIAYIFKEGEDIISLGYEINDADIYQKVVCYGTKTDGTSCFAQTNYTSRVYYNVLPNKYMKIDAGSAAQTAEAAQLLTNRAEILMRSRVRICQFAAVAVPQLQIGDVIQVIETSSTISEAYRVTDLSTTMDDTYTMMITCYHHSYTE